MSRIVVFAAIAACVVCFAGTANASGNVHAQLRPPQLAHVTLRKAGLGPSPFSLQRLAANTKYIGTVTSISSSIGVGYVTYNQDDGHFYFLSSQSVYRLDPNGQTLIATINGYGNGIVWDHTTQLLYVTVAQSYEVLYVTTTGLVNVLAGGTYGIHDGQGSLAQFVNPTGIVLDPANDLLYVADNDRMRRIDTSGNVVTVGPIGVLTGGTYQMAYDTKSAQIGIVTYQPGIIGLYSTGTQTYSPLAGACYPPPPGSQGCYPLQEDGIGSAAIFCYPNSIAYSAHTDKFYVSDNNNYEIRSVSPKGRVTTIAGNGRQAFMDGVGYGAEFVSPQALALNTMTDQLLVSDAYPYLRLVTTTGQVPPPIPHSFAMKMTPTVVSGPTGMAAATGGSLWFGESAANYLTRISPTGHVTEHVLPTHLGGPYDTTLGADGNIWFGDYRLDQYGNPVQSFVAHTLPNGRYAEIPFPENCGFQSSTLTSLTAASNGYMWFGGNCPGAVGFFTPTNQLVLFPSLSVGGIAVGLGTDVWVGSDGQLTDYSSTGAVIATYSNVPADAGVAIGTDGGVWILSNRQSAVGRFDPTTHTVTLYTLPSCNCNFGRSLGNLITAPNGDLWFTEGNRSYFGAIGQMTEAGVYTEYPVFEPRSQPAGIAFSKSGKLWISDIGAQKIGYMR
jgi:sugar lactone lactonase YvrE